MPDPRGRRRRRYPLPPLLTIVPAARLAGSKTRTRIADYGRALNQQLLQDLGIPRWRQTGRYHAPDSSTLHYALKRLDPDQFEERLAAWTRAQAPSDEPLALDG